MHKVIVQFNAPINVEIETDDLDEKTILDALWGELQNRHSKNDWHPTYDNLKEVIRNGYFPEDDLDNMQADKSFILYN